MAMVELVDVVLGVDDEWERPYFMEGTDADPPRSFHRLVPKALVDEANAGYRSAAAAVKAMHEFAGLVDGLPPDPCPAWQGTEHSTPSWWQVVLRSTSPDEYPANDVGLNHFDSEAAAAEFVAGLPDELWVPAYSRLLGPFPRDRFEVVGPRGGFTSVSECERCGHRLDDHVRKEQG